jgi:aspartate/methionine/tyrosine aminotransferase
MTFIPFDLERWQSTWEKRVRFNLSESGVHPLSIAELVNLSGGSTTELMAVPMGYNYSDGSTELRSAIADLYAGASPDDVTVTIGSSEANFITCWTLVQPGDHVAVVTPTYMQTHGLVRNFGATVSEIPLRPQLGWEPDPNQVERAISPGTKLVVVTNPNNPTGHVLSDTAREAIVTRTRDVGAWLLADEVYQGAELDGRESRSHWGAGDRVIIVNGLSKAYGLPGLRIGWIVSSPEFKQRVLQRHDYTVIGPSPGTDHLATLAVRARTRILDRTRSILNENLPLLEEWLAGFGDLFDWHTPECGAICLVRYRSPLGALEVVERIRAEHDILVVPGDHFGLPHHLRLGYGNEQSELRAALGELRRAVTRVFMD